MGRVVRPLRVVLIEFTPSGGLFHFAFQLGEALAAQGHRVELITGEDPEFIPRVRGFEILPVLPTWHASTSGTLPPMLHKARRVVRAVRYVEAWRRVVAFLRAQHVDAAMWSIWRFPIDGWFFTWLASRVNRTAWTVVAHEPRPFDEQRGEGSLYTPAWSFSLLRRALGAAYKRLDAVFVLGDKTGSELLDLWPGVRRVEVIPHGDERIFAQFPVPPPDACPARILFFGIWNRYKGLDLLFDAFAVLRSRMPEAELVVAGAVGKGVDVAALRRRAEEIGGVDLRPGYVPAAEVADLVGQSRVIAIPYLQGTQSGVVHVAQTFGRPVVATAVGDIPAAVGDGTTGLVVPPRDVASFAAALERLLGNPSEAARMGRNARERVAVESSWEVVAARVAEVLQDLAEAKQAEADRNRV
ncbi:MAG: glycosyltransferase family 4 protein [Nitriliruptorales bacterium]